MPLITEPELSSRSRIGPLDRKGSRTLLIVDDEEGPRQALRIIFRQDFEVLLAENGFQALELAHQHAIDAAVVDIRMAGMSGIEVLSGLKRIDPAIEVIMLTAYETIETVKNALRLGACDYLNKPFDLATMRRAVANAMDHRSLSTQIRANDQKLQELQSEIQSRRLAEEVARNRGEIYASIIHDMRGPLTVISGFIELINQGMTGADVLAGEDLELLKDRLTRITRQITNCVEISRRYLSLLKERTTSNTVVKANQVLNDLNEMLLLHPTHKSHVLAIQPLISDILAEINGTDFIQILLNLAINAFQCSEEPHRVDVQARVLAEPPNLNGLADGPEHLVVNRGGFRATSPLLAVSVKDNGPGIPPEVIQKVFMPYFTTKSSHQGSGMGLAIVQRLVKESGSAIHLQTQLGRGTTFTLYVPARALD